MVAKSFLILLTGLVAFLGFASADDIEIWRPSFGPSSPPLTWKENIMVVGEIKSESPVGKAIIEVGGYLVTQPESFACFLYRDKDQEDNEDGKIRTIFKTFIKLKRPASVLTVQALLKSGNILQKAFPLRIAYTNQHYKDNFTLLTSSDVHKDAINSLDFSRDGRYLITGSDDKNIHIVDPKTLNVLKVIKGHKSYVRKALITPDNKNIVSCSDDCTVKVWDTETGNLLHTFEGHSKPVRALALSYDGKMAASGAQEILLWNLENRTSIAKLTTHIALYNVLAFTNDDQYLVSGSEEKRITVWDILNQKSKYSRKNSHTDAVLSLAITPNGQYLYSGDKIGYIKWWQVLLNRDDKAWEDEDFAFWEMRLTYVKDRLKDPLDEFRSEKVFKKFPVQTFLQAFSDDDDKFEFDAPYSGGDKDTDDKKKKFSDDCSLGTPIIFMQFNGSGEFLFIVLEKGEIRLHERFTAIKRYDYNTNHILRTGAFAYDGSMAATADIHGKVWIFGIK